MGSTKTLRAPVKRMFTLAISEFEKQMNEVEPDQTEVEIVFKRLESHFGKLSGLDQAVEQEMVAAKASEDELDKEYEGVTDYGDKFTRAEVKFRKLVSGSTGFYGGSVKSSHSSSIKEKRSKCWLPKMELKKFNGDPMEWLGFWSQFNSIHKDKEIEPEEKFQYLIQATIEGSPAREVVESFPATHENYEKVIEHLESSFGSDELRVEGYVRDLLCQVLNNSAGKAKASITALYDKLDTQLRGLETLGVTGDKYAAMLYPFIESALPEDILRIWERAQSKSTYGKPSEKLTRLMEFLKIEVDGEVEVRLAKEGFGKEQAGKPKWKNTEEDISTAADSSLLVTSVDVNEVNIQDFGRLDLIGITEPSESKTSEDLIKAASEQIPGDSHPCDLPSRGCSSKQLDASVWWEGPDWLKSQESEASGKFELRGWIWNSENVTTMQPITPLIGLKWNVNTDKLTLDLRSALTYEEGPVTKRIILSQSHRIFDPIGFSCPVTLLPKKLVQNVWKTKAGWDEEVPEEISKQYLSCQGQLPELEKLEVERQRIKRRLVKFRRKQRYRGSRFRNI